MAFDGWRSIGGNGVRLALALLFVTVSANAAAPPAPLQFRITEGRVTNAFYQQGPVSAHLLLSAGTQPRVLVAFPAGNSGVGVWFEPTRTPVQWTLGEMKGVSRPDARGRVLHGIEAQASVDGSVVVRDAVLSSVRVLRDYQINGAYPAEVKSAPKVTSSTIEWSRPRLDGAAGYALTIAVENGEVRGGNGKPLSLTSSRAGEPLRLRITALTGETPLTPLSSHLLNTNANDDRRSREVLTFLSYEEKFLAGSWRFNTYFGRDTLMSLRLLLPVLEPQAVEGGLEAVVQRLAANGEVAHEEDIGEFAVLRHRKQGGAASDAPIYDYNMIDDDFMLAPVAAAYVFEHPRGHARAREFLARRTANGETIGAALARNFNWVVRSAQPFAQEPAPANLISLKPGLKYGEWRDSQDGLAGGRYPFDVNVVFVPAAMAAIEKFVLSGLMEPYLSRDQRRTLATAGDMAVVWSREAPGLFRVQLSNADARRQISTYAKELGVNATPALDALRERRNRRECNRARRAVPAGPGPAFRRRIRAAVSASASARRRGDGGEHAAPFPRRPADRRGFVGRESRVRRCNAAAPARPHRVSRHRHVVVAASAACGRSRATDRAVRLARRHEQALARGA